MGNIPRSELSLFLFVFQGVDAKLRLPAEHKGKLPAASGTSVEELPHSLTEAIESYESNQSEYTLPLKAQG